MATDSPTRRSLYEIYVLRPKRERDALKDSARRGREMRSRTVTGNRKTKGTELSGSARGPREALGGTVGAVGEGRHRSLMSSADTPIGLIPKNCRDAIGHVIPPAAPSATPPVSYLSNRCATLSSQRLRYPHTHPPCEAGARVAPGAGSAPWRRAWDTGRVPRSSHTCPARRDVSG